MYSPNYFPEEATIAVHEIPHLVCLTSTQINHPSANSLTFNYFVEIHTDF